MSPLAIVVVLIALLGTPAAANAAPSIVGTIPFPGNEPLDVEVYETGNKVLVTEDNTGKLYIFDGASLQQLASITVGSSAFDLVVNETNAKAYVASDGGCCSTGFTQGNGLISVIDLTTNQLIEQINPGTSDPSTGACAWRTTRSTTGCTSAGATAPSTAASASSIRRTRTTTPWTIPGATPFPDDIEVNTVTNKVFLTRYFPEELVIVDGVTHAVDTVPWPAGHKGALDLAVNEVENKAYTTMLFLPGQAEIGIQIYDRDTGSFKVVGRDDLEPLAFNQASNRLFSGVQVGSKGAIVEGATDLFTELDLGAAGIGSDAIDVRSSTDNAYMASSTTTVVVNGANKCAAQFTTAPDFGGGIVASDVAANQTTGRVYVNNRQLAGVVTVFQDDGPACLPAPPATPTGENPAAGPVKRCKGKKATGSRGTRGNDVIVGTAGRNKINAGAGNDLVCARGGNDRVRGGAGRDRLFGEGGKDRLLGQAGKDTLIGGGGADTLRGGPGKDRLRGGPGKDAERQ